MPTCPLCEAIASGNASEGEELARRRHWRVRSHPPPSPIAGWTILDLLRHAESIDRLDPAEAAELAGLLVEAVAAVKAATGCERVYLLAFAEAVPHPHLHLAPRHADDATTRSWSIADRYRQVAAGSLPAAGEPDRAAAAARIAAALAAATPTRRPLES
jgi:diadenosine tetraphosphate (Ap4A) HIT family hydrolase